MTSTLRSAAIVPTFFAFSPGSVHRFSGAVVQSLVSAFAMAFSTAFFASTRSSLVSAFSMVAPSTVVRPERSEERLRTESREPRPEPPVACWDP